MERFNHDFLLIFNKSAIYELDLIKYYKKLSLPSDAGLLFLPASFRISGLEMD